MQPALSSIATMHRGPAVDVRIAKEAGSDGLFIVGSRICRCLAARLTLADAGARRRLTG